MTTEARKAYEHNMPRWEMVLRDRLKNERKILRGWKEDLRQNHELLQYERRAGISEDRMRLFKENISWVMDIIRAQKHIIQILKNDLPQRRPKGVMAKCPFCGAKQWQRERLGLKGGWFIAEVPALWAFDNKDDGIVVAKCARCGAMFKMHNQKHSIQDAIDAWNRRK